MATKELLTIEDKLYAMYNLQLGDSKIDEIRVLRGELPIEVKDLEDEITGLEKRVQKLEAEKGDLNNFISNNLNKITDCEKMIEKYEGQQGFVKNNREYDALTKEIEMQKLEIELALKKNRDAQKEIDNQADYLNKSIELRDNRQKDLVEKKKELAVIIAETEKEEEALVQQSKEASEQIDARLITAYRRVRKTYRNGLAVVAVERNSCGGCFGKIPPQRQLEIRQRKKIITCEHCGRILIDGGMKDELMGVPLVEGKAKK